MQTLLRVLSLAVFLMMPVANAFAAAAYVHELQGTLTGQYGSAPATPLKIGDLVDPGVLLTTGEKSTAVVKFEDGQIVVLQPNTQFAVRQYTYNAKQVKDSNILFQLVQGGLRFVTGVIGATNHDAFKLTVGTATIGVRGTDGIALYIQGVITAAVSVGSLALQTPLGIANIPTGTFTSAPPTAPPSVPSPIAQAAAVAPVVAAQLAQATAVAVPINTPVVVQASANAAAAQNTARIAAQVAAAAPTNAAAQQIAAQAAAAAQAALQTAVQAASQAFQQAVQAGATVPTPPAPPTAPPTPPAPTPVLTQAQVQETVQLLQQAIQVEQQQLQQIQQQLNLPPTTPVTTAPQTQPPALPPTLPPVTTPVTPTPSLPGTPASPS